MANVVSLNHIECPCCGTRYAVREIFMDQDLAKEADLKDAVYICDSCDTKFYTKALFKTTKYKTDNADPDLEV